jgi:hypothetical protein
MPPTLSLSTTFADRKAPAKRPSLSSDQVTILGFGVGVFALTLVIALQLFSLG